MDRGHIPLQLCANINLSLANTNDDKPRNQN